jgi:hypothetical protein
MPPRPLPPELECPCWFEPCDEPPPSTDPTMPPNPPELCLLPPMTLFSSEPYELVSSPYIWLSSAPKAYAQAPVTLLSAHSSGALVWRWVRVPLSRRTARRGYIGCSHGRCFPGTFAGTDLNKIVLS